MLKRSAGQCVEGGAVQGSVPLMCMCMWQAGGKGDESHVD